jgi:hypothetical protein
VDGYAAVMYAPCLGLVAELLEVYPDAIVTSASTMVFLRFILFLLPGMRLFPDYISVLRKQWMYFYREREAVTRKTYEEHVAYLARVVPKDILVFYDFREG